MLVFYSDAILFDSESIVRTGHYLEDKIGECFKIPDNLSADYGLICEKLIKLNKR